MPFQIPYIDYSDPRARKAMPPTMVIPDDQEAAASAYQLPFYSRPQAEDPRTAKTAQRAGIPTDPDIPEMNMGMADEILPVRQPIDIPHFAMPARAASPVSGDALDPPVIEQPLPVRRSMEIPHFPAPSAATASIPETLPPGVPSENVPTPPVFTPQPPPRQPGTGWKGRLASIGRGALYGMGMGGQQGGTGAIGGALAGAITGAASPRTIARWGSEADQSRWRQTHELEEQDATRETNRENVRRDNVRADQEMTLRAAQQKTSEGYRTDAAAETKHQHREEAAKNHVQLTKQFGGTVDRAAVAGTSQESFGGRTYEKPATATKECAPWGHGVDAKGVWAGVYDDTTGEPKVIRPGGGQGVQPPHDPSQLTAAQQLAEKHKADADEREARKQEAVTIKAEEKEKDGAEGERRRAQFTINNYWRVKSDPKATPAQIAAALQEARVAVNDAKSNYPDLLDGDDEAPVPSIGWKGGKRPPPTAVAPRSSTQGGSGSKSKTYGAATIKKLAADNNLTEDQVKEQLTEEGRKKGVSIKFQ